MYQIDDIKDVHSVLVDGVWCGSKHSWEKNDENICVNIYNNKPPIQGFRIRIDCVKDDNKLGMAFIVTSEYIQRFLTSDKHIKVYYYPEKGFSIVGEYHEQRFGHVSKVRW